MPLRPCLGNCGTLVTGSRCYRCKAAARNAGTPWKVLRQQARDLADGRCSVPSCATPYDRLCAHHIVPLSEGGTNTLANIEMRCDYHHKQAHRGR